MANGPPSDDVVTLRLPRADAVRMLHALEAEVGDAERPGLLEPVPRSPRDLRALRDLLHAAMYRTSPATAAVPTGELDAIEARAAGGGVPRYVTFAELKAALVISRMDVLRLLAALRAGG